MSKKRLCLEVYCETCGTVLGHEPYKVKVEPPPTHVPRWSLLLQAKEWLENERYNQDLYWVADLLALVEKEMQKIQGE